MLEERLKPEVRNRLHDTYTRGQILLNSGLVQEGFSFQRALEDFYDLRLRANSTGYIIHNPYQVEFFPPIIILEREKQNDVKLGQVPRNLVKTLDTFGNNIVLRNLADDRELTYGRVRESYAPDYSKIERNYNILFHGSVTTAAISMASTFYLMLHNQNFDHLFWTAPFFVIGMVGAFIYGTSSNITRAKVRAEKKAEKNPPLDVKRRRDAFWMLHETAKEADLLLKEYNQYFT